MNTFGYVVIDRRTGAVVARCKTLNGARRSADRRDNQYGGYRYLARAAMPSEAAGFRSAS
jgi:hypothetical protein